jgi:hypothetical protein
MMRSTKAFHLLKEAQQEAVYERQTVKCMAAEGGVCEGLGGGFISFDQHVLMLSTIERFVDVVFLPHIHQLSFARPT